MSGATQLSQHEICQPVTMPCIVNVKWPIQGYHIFQIPIPVIAISILTNNAKKQKPHRKTVRLKKYPIKNEQAVIRRNNRTHRLYLPNPSYQGERLCTVLAFPCDKQYIFVIQSGKDTYRPVHSTCRTAYSHPSFSVTDSQHKTF